MTDMEIIDDGAEMTEKQAAEFVATVEQAAADTAAPAADTAAPAADAAAAATTKTVLTQADFEQHFFEVFDIIGDLWDMPEFKIQHDKPFEVAGAKVSAAKLYIMAEKYKMLHFLIEPAGGWFGDMVAIGCFVGAKANIVCRKYTGNGLSGYLKRFMKKSSEQVKNNSFMSRFFNKGKKDDSKKGK